MGNRSLLLLGAGGMIAILLAIGSVTALAPEGPLRLAAVPKQSVRPAPVPPAGEDAWIVRPAALPVTGNEAAPAEDAGVWSIPAEFAPPE